MSERRELFELNKGLIEEARQDRDYATMNALQWENAQLAAGMLPKLPISEMASPYADYLLTTEEQLISMEHEDEQRGRGSNTCLTHVFAQPEVEIELVEDYYHNRRGAGATIVEAAADCLEWLEKGGE